ncbi:MAG TPA: TetR/AcrR family transcriptional regulator [Microthrixaceae bacterium]|nr:TetR/AcrR family transcriptional regulator [Microthrixaceae bacterium]HQF93875.1 TetR/AcrR family transcriptional regulator [Microthrixaceae bacterium]
MGSDFVAIKDHGAAKQEPDLDTRERLVRAAIEVFLEKGYGGTRVQDIARRAGFTSGALYVHFPSRTALLGEAIIREGQTIMTGLADQIDAAADTPDSIADLLAGFSSGAPTKLDLLLLEALALASRSDEAKEVLATALDGFVEILMKRINVARERGDIDTSIDTEALRQVFVAWIFGGVVVKALKIGTAPIDSLTDATRRLIGGLAPTA